MALIKLELNPVALQWRRGRIKGCKKKVTCHTQSARMPRRPRLDWAKGREFCTGENPARLKGHLDHLLPARSKVQKVQPSEVVEAALAHVIWNKVEAAYQRGDLFEKRRVLMKEWADYCSMPNPAAPSSGD